MEMRRMTDVVLGTNRFVGCDTIVSLEQQALLRVHTSPLRVSLTTPPNLPSGMHVQVVDNVKQTESLENVVVVAGDTSVAIFWSETPLVIATLLAESLVSLRVDLRPIGINMFDDANGLHIGGNHFSGNWISGSSTAIALG
jgi:hypothetical protein